jgi:hypothetical protein
MRQAAGGWQWFTRIVGDGRGRFPPRFEGALQRGDQKSSRAARTGPRADGALNLPATVWPISAFGGAAAE